MWPVRSIVAALAAAWCAAQAMPSAAGANAPKCQRRATFGLIADLNVDPGEPVGLKIVVKKRSTCFSKPSMCTVLLTAPDGAAVSTSFQGLAEEAIVNDDFSQYYAWSLANLSNTSRNVQWAKDVALVYSLPFVSADICAPRAALSFTVSLVVDPRSQKRARWRKHDKLPRPGKRCTRMVEVSSSFMSWAKRKRVRCGGFRKRPKRTEQKIAKDR